MVVVMTEQKSNNPAYNPNCPYCTAKLQHKSREEYTFYHPLAGHVTYDDQSSYSALDLEIDRKAKQVNQSSFAV
jgi:hypothetical protein